MTDHLNTIVCRPIANYGINGKDSFMPGFHLCPEGDGRIVGPGTEGWEECQCREKRKTKNANHSYQN